MSTKAGPENTETVATYADGDLIYEIDHLGIGRPTIQTGYYAIYQGGRTVADFSAGVQLSLCSVQFTDAPEDNDQLIAMAREAVADCP